MNKLEMLRKKSLRSKVRSQDLIVLSSVYRKALRTFLAIAILYQFFEL